MKVYIASPYTMGDLGQNVFDSLAVADEILKMGHVPFAPLLSHFWHIWSPKTYDVWMKYCLEWVTACDAVYRIKGASKGADEEVARAEELGIPVVYSLEELKNESKRRKGP